MENQNKEASASNDIRISYTYQADIDDMKAHREKITEYLDSSDPYNADVIFGREKTSISSYAGQSEGKRSYKWFVIMLAAMLTVTGIQMLCGKLLEGTRYYVLQEYVQMIPVSILFMIVAVYAEISIITGNTRQKKRRCKSTVSAKIADIKLVRDRDNNTRTLPVYKFIYNGKIYIIASITYANFSKLYVGQEVVLLINEDDPEDFFIETDTEITCKQLFSFLPFILIPWMYILYSIVSIVKALQTI